MGFRTKEAQEVYEKALFYDRNNPDIYYNVCYLFFLISVLLHAAFLVLPYIRHHKSAVLMKTYDIKGRKIWFLDLI